MNSSEDPWQEIRPVPNFPGRTERRVDPLHPISFYRARAADGRYLFVLKDLGIFGNVSIPSLGGIDVRVEGSELIVELTDEEQVSLFRVLAQDLLDATSDLPSAASDLAGTRVIFRLERWQALLRRRRNDLLSRMAIIGLAGELMFLRDRLLPKLGVEHAVRCWRGPFGEEQDFAVGDNLIELKTQLSTADRVLQISSEDQLDFNSGCIILCHQTVASANSGDADSDSLNEIVQELAAKCREVSLIAHDLLFAALLAVGYEARAEYDVEYWQPVQFRTYAVREGFPAIVPSGIPTGVSNVSYRVSLSVCDSFERTEDWLDGVICGEI